MTIEELLERYERGRVWYDYDIRCRYFCAICGKDSETTGTNYHDKNDSKITVIVCRECDHKTRGKIEKTI